MANRRFIWVFMVVGGAIWMLAKRQLGIFPDGATWGDLLTMLYGAAGGLSIHWYLNRVRKPN